MITLIYFVENYLDLPEQYLRNKGIPKVLVNLFPEITQFTCDKWFITFAQMGIYPLKAFTNLVLFTNTSMHT